jgi:hypothetical protein
MTEASLVLARGAMPAAKAISAPATASPLAGTEMANATAGSIRLKLLKH